MEGAKDGSGMWEKPVVKIHRAQELLQLLGRVRTWETADGLHSVLGRNDAMSRYLVPQEVQRPLSKHALVDVDDEAVVCQELEHLPQVLLVLLFRPAGHQDVVQVNVGVGESLENVVHEPLEHLAGVRQTKGHP